MFLNSSVNFSEYQQIFNQYEDCKAYTKEIDRFGKPMLWIGIYIATGSVACFIAMAADTICGFLQKRLWFPCKNFTLNAASLTLLSVAMKPPLDLSTPMPSEVDQLVKLSSMAFICTAMGNFMPSLGRMDGIQILTNFSALGILVITLIVNVGIELYTGVIYYPIKIEYLLVSVFMLFLVVLLSSSALTVSTTKKYLEWKYRDVHKMNSDEDEVNKVVTLTVEKLESDVQKYWIMAETACPQFVMARSVTCSAAGAICFMTAIVLVEAEIRIWLLTGTAWLLGQGKSDYKFSNSVILVIDSVAVLLCTTAPALRWFTAISFTLSEGENPRFRDEFKIEKYWIKKLLEWKESPIAIRINNGRKRKKFVHDLKQFTLDFCIGLQVLIVLASKTTRLIISVFFISPVLLFCHLCNKLKKKLVSKPSSGDCGKELDLSRYVLKLEGEKEVPKIIVKNIFQAVNRLIQKGRNNQPDNLMDLILKSVDFKGVAEFDSDLVEHLFSEEPSNCWSMPVVTLTSIAISLPKVNGENIGRLLCSVSEGLLYIRLIEKSLDAKRDLAKIRKSADAVWLGIELYSRWMDLIDLRKFSSNGKTSEENLRKLGDIAKNSVLRFKKKMTRDLEENPRNWPIRVIAANSLYRISQTILLTIHASNNDENEMLFEQLSVMIADILGACFTNLPRVISLNCYCSSIENREESIRLAARILGETEAILKIIQKREIPSWGPDRGAYIDEWYTFMKQQTPSKFVSSSTNGSDSLASGELHIDTG